MNLDVINVIIIGKNKMKKAIIEQDIRFRCPYCKESRNLMLLTARGDMVGFNIEYSKPGDIIQCVSCKKTFRR